MEMSRLRTPLLSVVIGEGGSGGALGLGTGDRLIISEYAYYSVISPEGCAAILWRSGDDAAKAAEALKLTANDLVGLGIMDEIVPEPPGGAHNDPGQMAANLKKVISRGLAELVALPVDRLLELRYEKYRRIGYFLEGRKEVNPRQPAAPTAGTAAKPKRKPRPTEASPSAAAAKNEKPAANG
jgi:acetyl-CoA carboxylase carboxyl transferase subunit alpha